MPSARFEHAIPAIERPQGFWVRLVTGIGLIYSYSILSRKVKWSLQM